MKRVIRRIIYITPLLMGVMLIYGIFTGELEKKVNEVKLKIDERKASSDKKEDTYNKRDNEEATLPDGKISIKENFTWDIPPRVDEYDPDNKLPGNYMYGYTKEEIQYQEKLGYKQCEYDEKVKLPEELKGHNIFNKEKMIEFGEEFEIKFNKLKCKYENLIIREDFLGLDKEYYSYDKEILLSKLDADGKLQNVSLWKDNQEIKNVDVKLVMFDVAIVPSSEWVTECEVVPWIYYLQEKNGALVELDSFYYREHGELGVVEDRPIYFDLGLYDFDTAGINDMIYHCPMRKGETVTFTVGYLIPEELMDNAYIIYNTDCWPATDYSYNTKDIAILKITD